MIEWLTLAQSSGYEPFSKPLPVWDYWYLLALPLCLGIAVVYKAIRCNSIKQVPKEALVLFAFIVVVMVVAAGALAALVDILS